MLKIIPKQDSSPFAVDIVPIPGKNGPVSRLSDDVLVVFRRYSRAKRAGIGFALDFLTGPAFQNDGTLVKGSSPTRASILDALRQEDGSGVFGEFTADIRGTPPLEAWPQIESEVAAFTDRAYRWKRPNPAG